MEGAMMLRFMAALLAVLALIGGLALAARRAGFAMRDPRGRSGPRRTAIVEVTPVDARRRLVLIRRDDVEHLILLGGDRDLVVETGIQPRPSAFAAMVEATPASGPESA